jgi:hypothetical protein
LAPAATNIFATESLPFLQAETQQNLETISCTNIYILSLVPVMGVRRHTEDNNMLLRGISGLKKWKVHWRMENIIH